MGNPPDNPLDQRPQTPSENEALTAEWAPWAFPPGSKVSGRYRIEQALGRGAFGEVYRAYDEVLGRAIALKAFGIKKASAQLSEQLDASLEEARTIAKLDHPNIVPVYDVGREGNATWMAMKLVQGENLDTDIRKKGKLEAGEAFRFLKEVAGALDHAHRRGIIHRDVKPSNILIERREDGEEHVWLADFGIAKILTGPTTLRERFIAGTPSYMSPEQINGKRVDARTDIFALGCVAYELLTGKRAFAAETHSEAIYRVVHEQPEEMGRLASLAGKRCEAMIRRALAKFPEDRFQTVEEFAKELEAVARGEESAEEKRRGFPFLRLLRHAPSAQWDGMHVLTLRDISKGYGFKKKVIAGINLNVKTGSIYALLGRNGSGKTTLIRTFLAIYRKDSGSVAIFGRDPYREGPAVLSRLGFVPESLVAYDSLTISGLVHLLRAFYPKWDNAYFYQLLGRYELPLDTKIRDFSKGMKTKVSLIAALSHRPELLILDDPTIGLDAVTLTDVFETLQEVSRQEGTSVFIASHNIDEVEKIASHIGFLKDGSLLLSDTLEGLKTRTREVRLTFPDDVPELPAIAQFKPVKASGRRLTGVIFDTSSSALERLKALRPADMEVRELTLKEIFVNLLR
jgi:ABC-type multidrug transport system ATPase subunit/tRNA A-37 threonylcarbamoyl transferase component Bud32